MNRFLTIVAIGAVACSLASGAQMIRYVSVDGTNNPPYTSWADAATSIVDAVTAANANNSGDIVWVSNGTHQVTATISIGNTKVRGVTGDYRDVIVDGGGNTMTYAAFRLTHADAELSAVTVTNCTGGSMGAGVCLFGSSSAIPVGMVSNCLITSCSAVKGAAIYYQCTNGVVAHCVIQFNTASGGSPFHADATTAGGALIHDTLFASNVCESSSIGGGGIYINSRNFQLRDTTFSGNTALGPGGAIVGRYSALFERCLVVSNVATAASLGPGGGCYFSLAGAQPVFSNCTIVGNSTAWHGGGMYFRYANQTLYNCVVDGNTASYYGGGLYLESTATEMHNCTIVNNSTKSTSSSIGGGIHNATAGNGVLVNTIVYSNWLTHATSVNSNYVTTGGNVFTNCCTVPMPTNGTGNITDTPGLRDMAARQYEPVSGSKCIDKGVNETWMNGAVDLSGRQRLDRFTRQADIGAFEYVYPGSLLSVR